MSVELIVLDDEGAATEAAAELLAEAARRGGHIALSGGSTPEQAYERAATLEPAFGEVELWWGDERCVPPDDERSNFLMAERAMIRHLQEPPREIHRIRGELEPAKAADEYDETLRDVRFAVNLLGIGPDGHTASLFPNSWALDETERLAVAVAPGLEPMVPRVTLTPPALCNADTVLFLATGEAKAEAAARAFAAPESRATPASVVRSRGGRTIAILDRAAAALLRD
jgi:6-phosphogluconolactonase